MEGLTTASASTSSTRSSIIAQPTLGSTHTNTIEGFWSLLKRAGYGQHHHYSKLYTLLYLAEACWKYNMRKNDNAFRAFLRGCFG